MADQSDLVTIVSITRHKCSHTDIAHNSVSVIRSHAEQQARTNQRVQTTEGQPASSVLLTHEQSTWRRVDAKAMPETVAPSVVDKQRRKCHGNGGKNLCQHLQIHYINMNKINCN